MIILRKKRLLIIGSCLILSISVFALSTNTTKTKSQNTIQTVALPVSQKTIVVDAGHRKA